MANLGAVVRLLAAAAAYMQRPLSGRWKDMARMNSAYLCPVADWFAPSAATVGDEPVPEVIAELDRIIETVELAPAVVAVYGPDFTVDSGADLVAATRRLRDKLVVWQVAGGGGAAAGAAVAGGAATS